MHTCTHAHVRPPPPLRPPALVASEGKESGAGSDEGAERESTGGSDVERQGRQKGSPGALEKLFIALRWLRLGRFLRVGLFVLLASSLVSNVSAMFTRGRPPAPSAVLYSRFLDSVRADEVDSVRFIEGTKRIQFVKKADKEKAEAMNKERAAAEKGKEKMIQKVVPDAYVTRRVDDDRELLSTLTKHGVEYGAEAASFGSSVQRMLMTVLALWLPLLPLFFIARRAMGGRDGGNAKRRKKGDDNGQPRITFKDVAGIPEAKAELQEVVNYLRNPGKYRAVGAKLPTGVLLCGPPGTGKTLLARAVAGEAGVPFFSANASEFVEMFVGRGAARVRELFREAKSKAPAVLFIDEVDAVGARRGMASNDERDQTLNQMLAEMDGFDGGGNVVVIFATNREEVLDPALCRPGRIARRVTVGVPDEEGRRAILAVHLRDVPVAPSPVGVEEGVSGAAAGTGSSSTAAGSASATMDATVAGAAVSAAEEAAAKERVIVAVAAVTAGFAGAELANVVNEGALLAARGGRDRVQLENFMEAVERAKVGVGAEGIGADIQKAAARWMGRVATQATEALDGGKGGPGGPGGPPGGGARAVTLS